MTEAGRPADSPAGTPVDQVRALLNYVASTSGATACGAVARVRLAAADTALALANDTSATVEVVTACVQAVKEAVAAYYGHDPAEPGAFDDVLQDMIARAEARDAGDFSATDVPGPELHVITIHEGRLR